MTDDVLKHVIADLKFLSCYQKLSEKFMLDFYNHNLLDLINPTWKESFDKNHLVNLLRTLTGEETLKTLTVFPLSMLCFTSIIRSTLRKRCYKKVDIDSACYSKKSQIRHLKPKKIIELKALLPHICAIINDNNITHVVDVGSGVGHASRAIAASTGCSVLRIECQDQLLEKAQKIDKKFSNVVDDEMKIYSSSMRLQLDECISESFKEILQKSDAKFNTQFSSSDNILLLGLHPCGNLGSYISRLYNEYNNCGSLILISCCYLFIDIKPDSPTNGYPMSKTLKSSGVDYNMSSLLFQEACHNAEYYIDNLLVQLGKGDQSLLQQHWRAIADIFMIRRGKKEIRFKIKPKGNVLKFINDNFAKHELSELTKEEEFEVLKLAYDAQLTAFYYLVYTVKMCLGIVAENVILNDRLLYLLENNIQASIVPIFDPVESPRNIAIIATKTTDCKDSSDTFQCKIRRFE